ncbi:MAG: arsenate reductase ArsC [Methanoregula sp.]|nr:arsenate reductase ArsC [Methanoregula sp.]
MEINDITTEKSSRKRQVILFICTHNSARSQMAEGYLRARHGDTFDVHSAGTEVRGVNPVAIAVMSEIGIDISGHRSKLIDEFIGRDTDVVVTVCDNAHQSCPFFPGTKTIIHAGFHDPSACAGTSRECLDVFRTVRDEIIEWIDHSFVPEYGNNVHLR